MEEVFTNVSQHARKCRPQQVLNTRQPATVLAISLQVIDVLTCHMSDIITLHITTLDQNAKATST